MIAQGWAVPVTRVRASPAGVDQYGESIPGPEGQEALPAGLFAPGASSEPVSQGAAPVITAPTVYWPGQWPDIIAADVLIIGGVRYQVEGDPARWPMGLVVTLRAVTEAQ